MNLLNLTEVISRTGLTEDDIYKLIDKNQFPHAFGFVAGEIYWNQDDIRIWLNSKKH